MVESASDYLPSLSSFSKYDDTIVDSILVNYVSNFLTYVTVNSRSGNDIATESEEMHVTGESSIGETESVQEASDKVQIKFDEVVGKVIKGSKSYDITFWLGVVISYKQMKQDWGSKGMKLKHRRFFQET